MFSKLFAESGLSLDRLKALLEVGAAGSIVKAARGDPIRQSQYSRQIKELEDFFQTRLVERQGRGIRLTPSGRELARISRFFMLGLANFHRGCLTEEQTFSIGASATIVREFLLPALSGPSLREPVATYAAEVVGDGEIERRLHDLTLDFGIVSNAALSRPLQTKPLGTWNLELWMPKTLDSSGAAEAFSQQQLPLAVARAELDGLDAPALAAYPARLICDSFVSAKIALEQQQLGALLPGFLAPGEASDSFVRVRASSLDSLAFQFHLAWNPRLLRLNPHAARTRDWLAEALGRRMTV
jgi:DNA-binding transcriptional LysR family regulator